MNNMDKEELIGQIIDIFEDELGMRHKGTVKLRPTENDNGICKIVPVFQEEDDEFCTPVFYGGSYYDDVAKKIEETLKSWGLIKSNKLHVVKWEEKWCVSTSEEECYCDEEIWLVLGISENKFYELSRKHEPTYYHHTFDYGNDKKEVCDTAFNSMFNAQQFAEDLLEVANGHIG